MVHGNNKLHQRRVGKKWMNLIIIVNFMLHTKADPNESVAQQNYL